MVPEGEYFPGNRTVATWVKSDTSIFKSILFIDNLSFHLD